ncbi:MAG: S1C family serine protease [Limisphaerales bacterium]
MKPATSKLPGLATSRNAKYRPPMFLRNFALAVAVVISAECQPPDVVRLKDGASVGGRILAEKKDSIIVDLGYTVLAIPRPEVTGISRAEAVTGSPSPPADDENSETAVPVNRVKTVPDRTSLDLYLLGEGAGPEGTVRELVKELGSAVAQVRTPRGLGSGFFLNGDGYLITNFHVIENETQIGIEIYHVEGAQLERRVYRQVRIVALNKFDDLALLKVDDSGAPRFASVPLGSSDTLAVGERVFAIGSPLGLERTVTEGIVSTKTREMQGELFLQTTAQINPGNSGGPLFNLRGEVIGVTNMKLTSGEGLGFAIPVEKVRYFLKHRDAFAYDNDNPSNPFRYLEPPKRMRQSNSSETATAPLQ